MVRSNDIHITILYTAMGKPPCNYNGVGIYYYKVCKSPNRHPLCFTDEDIVLN